MKIAVTREQFWNYIAEAREKFEDDFDVIVYLTELMKKKSDEEIFGFGIILDEIMLESYNEKLWCASYLVNGEITEESFDFFRLWLISRGRETYEDVLQNPDNLIKYIDNPENEDFIGDFYENEDFFFIAVDAFGQKHKIEAFETVFEKYLDKFDEYKEGIGYADEEYPKIKFSWNEKVPKTIQKTCPNLYGRLYLTE